MAYKYRYRYEDGKHLTTIENDKGKRVDEKVSSTKEAALKLRDEADKEIVKSFADIGKKAEKADAKMPAEKAAVQPMRGFGKNA